MKKLLRLASSKIKSLKLVSIILGIGLLVSSCSVLKDQYLTKSLWGSPAFFAMGVGVDLAYTKKTPVGHIVSWITGKDCSILRVEAGKTYCKPDQKFVQAKEYCYHTLGGIDCYTTSQDQLYGEEVGDTYTPKTEKEQRRDDVHNYYRNKAVKDERKRNQEQEYDTDQYPGGN